MNPSPAENGNTSCFQSPGKNLKTVLVLRYIDSVLQKIVVENDEDKKVDLIFSIYAPGWDTNPNLLIEVGGKLLNQSQGKYDNIKEAAAYCLIGHGYRLSGNFSKGLEYHQKALALAEKSGNASILAMTKNQMGHVYRDREEFEKALQIYMSEIPDVQRGKNEMVKARPLMNLGAVYQSLGKQDSALKYLQRAYELCLKVDVADLPFVLWNLGAVHSRMGNAALAISFFNMAIDKETEYKTVRQKSWTYNAMYEHFQRFNNRDSAILYAKKAIEVVRNTDFFHLSIKPAQALANIYEKSNCDSTLKYATIFKMANDSLYSRRTNQQIQLMTFEEDLRQQELASEKIKVEEERKQNIQYALIALGIITFIILYLLLSRSFITNTKLIQFFGVVALLLVFEFLNLLLHPFLERVTHHSPLLMLLALVCIAALLVPLHHRMEKWATARLVEKNKQIRLAAAKKTIAELEKANS